MTAPDDDPREQTTDRRYRRRRVIAALAATASASLAGCSGGGDDSSDDTGDGSGPSDGGDDGSDDGTSSDDGSDNGSDDGPCPTGSFSYVTQEYSTTAGTTVGSFEAPESARIEITESTIQSGGTVILEYADGSFDSFGWTVQFTQDTDTTEQTVDSEVESVRGLEDQTAELTDRYNVGSDARVIATSEDPFPASVYVILPHPDGVLRVMLGTPNPVTCPDAAERVLTRLIESQQAI